VYAVQVSSVAAFTGLVFSTRTVGLSVPMTGLWPNTTYFAEVAIFSGGSTKTYVALGSSSTLALPPTPSFLGISTNSVSVDWIKYNTAVASDSAEGFELIASTAPNFTGTLFSSATPNGASATLSTLTVSGLAMLTTYYLEVGSVNWAGTTNYALVGSTLTADIIPPITVLSASTGPLVDTVSLDWTTTGVQNGAGVLNNGNFIIEYTTVTAFAQSAAWTPNGAIPAFVSSVTISTTAISPGSLSTDTLSGLISGDTYYIRVYEEDFGGYFSGLSLGATAYATPAFYALSLSTNVISLSMNAPSITSVTAAIIVTNIGNIGTTVQLSLTNPAFWTATASTPTADNFRVTGIFTSVLPSSTTFSAAADLISTTTMTASATTYAIVADPAGVKGFNIAPSATRNLFLRVELPVYTSTTTAQFILLNAVPGP